MYSVTCAYFLFVGIEPSCAANNETELHIIVAVLASVIFIGILSIIIWCFRHRWFINGNPKRNPESETNIVDTTYQELDLTKMNSEDNYQSLRFKTTQSNFEPQTTEVDTTYQQLDLSKMNTEDNYQSLTSRRP